MFSTSTHRPMASRCIGFIKYTASDALPISIIKSMRNILCFNHATFQVTIAHLINEDIPCCNVTVYNSQPTHIFKTASNLFCDVIDISFLQNVNLITISIAFLCIFWGRVSENLIGANFVVELFLLLTSRQSQRKWSKSPYFIRGVTKYVGVGPLVQHPIIFKIFSWYPILISNAISARNSISISREWGSKWIMALITIQPADPWQTTDFKLVTWVQCKSCIPKYLRNSYLLNWRLIYRPTSNNWSLCNTFIRWA